MAVMPDRHTLTRTLEAIDGRGFGAYKRLTGTHDLGPFRLVVDRVQTDPFAPPSLMRLVLDRDAVDLPEDLSLIHI